LNSDVPPSTNRIYLTLSEAAQNSGIEVMFIENNDMLTVTIKLSGIDKFTQRIAIDSKRFHQMVRTMIKDVKGMLKAKCVEQIIINEVGFQIGNTLNQEPNYKLFKDIQSRNEEPGSEDDEYKTTYISRVSQLRSQNIKNALTFVEYQFAVKQKYIHLQTVIKRNFPEAWHLLQFCLAVKSILNIDGCTLPFMGVILAIPSSMKTLVIQLFRKYPFTIYSDSFTPNSFESHNAVLSEKELRKIDLLPKLQNRLFLTPELAPVFTANEDELRKSLGIITRILDGHGLETDSGAQGHRKYGKTFFVWIGAGVEIPFRVWQLLGTLGHKIYFLRPAIPEKTVQELEKIARENNFQDKFTECENALLEYLIAFDSAPSDNNFSTDEDGIVKVKWNENESGEQAQAITCIAQIANLQKRLRGTVYVSQSKTRTSRYNSKRSSDIDNDNDKDSDKNNRESHESSFGATDESDYDTDYPIVEDPSRAVVMLRNLAIGNAISQGRNHINLEDISLIMKVALSTTSRARSELVRFLLRNSGELTTSNIVKENKISSPFAKKTMRELAALGIVEISGVASYSNSELKITLKDEYKWFKNQDFQKLFNNDQDSTKKDTSEDELSDTTDDIVGKTSSENHQSKDQECKNESIRDDCDQEPSQSHTETKPTLDTYIENSESCGILENKNSDLKASQCDNKSLDNNSSSRTNDDRQSKATLCDDTKTSDTLPELEEKNNASLWGSDSFQHMTVTESHANSDFLYALHQIAEKLKRSDGSTIAFNTIVETIHSQNERIKIYLGEKLTSRENKKVRNLAVETIRNKNIEVVKHKPILLVRWIEPTDPDDTPSAI
jgi:hypothetical protein